MSCARLFPIGGLLLVLAACGGGGSGDGGPAAAAPGVTGTLLPLLAGDGTLKLLDLAVALGADNPQTVDTGLAPPPSGAICDDCLGQAAVFIAGTRSGNAVTGLRAARLAYVRRGPGNDAGAAVFRVDLDRGASHAPRQLTSLLDVCALVPSETLDWLEVDHTAVVVERAGADFSCSSAADNVTAVLRLDSTATAAALDIALIAGPRNRLIARTGADGAIVGYASLEPGGPGGALLVRRDAALGAPLTLLALGQTTGANLERAGASHLFVTVTPPDEALQLRRIEPDGGLSDVLYSFTGFNAGNPIQDGVHSATHLFFSDENRLLRLPLDAAGPLASVLAALPCAEPSSCVRIENRAYDATTGRVVFEAQDDDITTAGGVFTAADGAGASAAAPLASNPEPSGQGGFALLHRLAAGRAYINVAYHGSPERATDALLAPADGSGVAVTYPGAYWAGSSLARSVDLDAAGGLPPPARLFLARRDSASGTDALSAFDPASASEGAALGSVAAASVFLAIDVQGVGSSALARVQIDREGALDYDVHAVDTAAPPLAPLAQTAGVNDVPLDRARRATGNLCLLCL